MTSRKSTSCCTAAALHARPPSSSGWWVKVCVQEYSSATPTSSLSMNIPYVVTNCAATPPLMVWRRLMMNMITPHGWPLSVGWRQSRSLSLSKRPIPVAQRLIGRFRDRSSASPTCPSAVGYTLLTTTLASSRWKDLEQVDTAGRWACDVVNGACDNESVTDLDSEVGPESLLSGRNKVLWWNQNWRRGGLQERRNALIKEWGMYNQTFCGCEFSERH